MSLYVGARDVVRVTGTDAVSYLQGQISQDVEALAIGDSAWSLVLQPQGKVDAWFRITRSDETEFLLDVDADFGDGLRGRLQRFLLRVDVQLDLNTWTWHAHRGSTPEVENAPISAAPAGGVEGLDLIGPELPDVGADLSLDEFERIRIEAGLPAMGIELTENTIPAESGVVPESVSFTKGCYTGQELVARVDSRGDNTPRKLRVVRADSTLAVGDTLQLEGADVAEITSAAITDQGSVALAYVRRAALDADGLTTASGEPVRIEVPGARA
ncbi:MAG: YgfZ/GcvT domain-containing protein [Acidimicrobiales bacterium]